MHTGHVSRLRDLSTKTNPVTCRHRPQLQKLIVHTHIHGLVTQAGTPWFPLPSYLLELRLRAFHSREASSDIQEVHVMPKPTAHLEYVPTVGDGLCEVLGIHAVRAYVEAEHILSDRWKNTCGNTRVSRKRHIQKH